MAAPLKVYGPTLSTAVSRVLACLLEKDVEFQLIPINMSKGEHKKPDFLRMQVLSIVFLHFTILLILVSPANQFPNLNVTAFWPSASFSR